MSSPAGSSICRDLLGRFADELEQRLSATTDWAARFELAEAAILQRISLARRGSPLARSACRALERTGGAIPVRDLARALDCSRKHLVTLFRREVGLPPKAYARVLRFERAVAGAARRQARLAGTAGRGLRLRRPGPPQSRLPRVLRRKPSALRKRMLPDGTGIIADPW